MMKKTIITLILALSVTMADERGCLNDYDANESIKVSFDILIGDTHCSPYGVCSESYERARECDESFQQACDKGKDKSGKFCYAAGLSLLADVSYGISGQSEKYLKKACEKNKDYCDYKAKIYKKKIDSVEGEDYEAYLTKGSIAFNAKEYKQAENYFRKGCEKAVSYEGTSVFDDFYQNCSTHTAMELFAKACEPNPNPWEPEGYGSSKSIWELDKYISCMQIGDMYYKGSKELQVKRNIPLAKNFYKKACEEPATYGYIRGAHLEYMFDYLHCKEFGNLYYSENNFVEAKKWWTKAIRGDYYTLAGFQGGDLKCSETDTIKEICEKHGGCFGECHYISIRGYFQEAEKYYKGYIVEEKGGEFDKNNNWIPKTTHIPHEKDYNKAFILASIGCDDFADSKSCYLLAKAYTEGKGTKQDSNLSQHYLKKGNKCEARKLLNEYRQNKELFGGEDKTLFELFEKACKLDSEISVTCNAILKEKGIK